MPTILQKTKLTLGTTSAVGAILQSNFGVFDNLHLFKCIGYHQGETLNIIGGYHQQYL